MSLSVQTILPNTPVDFAKLQRHDYFTVVMDIYTADSPIISHFNKANCTCWTLSSTEDPGTTITKGVLDGGAGMLAN